MPNLKPTYSERCIIFRTTIKRLFLRKKRKKFEIVCARRRRRRNKSRKKVNPIKTSNKSAPRRSPRTRRRNRNQKRPRSEGISSDEYTMKSHIVCVLMDHEEWWFCFFLSCRIGGKCAMAKSCESVIDVDSPQIQSAEATFIVQKTKRLRMPLPSTILETPFSTHTGQCEKCHQCVFFQILGAALTPWAWMAPVLEVSCIRCHDGYIVKITPLESWWSRLSVK